jgi:hypothetical protein
MEIARQDRRETAAASETVRQDRGRTARSRTVEKDVPCRQLHPLRM